jgi:hypothetical protein
LNGNHSVSTPAGRSATVAEKSVPQSGSHAADPLARTSCRLQLYVPFTGSPSAHAHESTGLGGGSGVSPTVRFREDSGVPGHSVTTCHSMVVGVRRGEWLHFMCSGASRTWDVKNSATYGAVMLTVLLG